MKVHVTKERNNFIIAVNGLLVDRDWYKKCTEGQQQKQARIEKARQKANRLKYLSNTDKVETNAKVSSPPKLSNMTSNNAYEAYENRPVGGGGGGGAMVFSGYQDENPISKTSVVLSIEETRYKNKKKKVNYKSSNDPKPQKKQSDKEVESEEQKEAEKKFLKRNTQRYDPR